MITFTDENGRLSVRVHKELQDWMCITNKMPDLILLGSDVFYKVKGQTSPDDSNDEQFNGIRVVRTSLMGEIGFYFNKPVVDMSSVLNRNTQEGKND